MGYYATGCGEIHFRVEIEGGAKQKLLSFYGNSPFDALEVYKEQKPVYLESGFDQITFEYDDKYHEDEVVSFLKGVAEEIGPIKSGVVEFTGEDAERWRFLWKNGRWVEQNATIVYEDVPGGWII